MSRALKRCPRENDVSEPGSPLAGSGCTLEFSQQLRYLIPCLEFAHAIIALNPETGSFCYDLIARRKSDAGADPLCFVRTAAENLAVQNHDDTK